jgi:hypothetical protein
MLRPSAGLSLAFWARATPPAMLTAPSATAVSFVIAFISISCVV